MDPYAVYVSMAPPVSFFSSLAAFSLVGVVSTFVDFAGARSGVTGGIEVAAVALGSGSSTYLDEVVVKVLEMKDEGTFRD